MVEWHRRPLKRVVRLNPSTLTDDTSPEQSIRYVDISNVQEARISAPEEMLFGNAPSRARRLVQNGDVILSTVRTYLRAVALVEDADRLVVSTGFAVLRPDAGLRSRFLWYVLQSEPFVADVMRHSEGVSYPAIPPERLATLKIAVPDDKEQQHIADFLDRETAKIDSLIRWKEHLRELGAERVRATARSLFDRDGLTHKLAWLARVGNGSTPSRERPEYWGGSTPWLTSGKLHERVITQADEFVTAHAERDCHLPVVPPRSVLIAITGEGKTRGTVAQVLFASTVSQHIAFVTVTDERLLPEFLLVWLNTQYENLRDLSGGGGSTKAALTCEDIRQLRVPLPSPGAQRGVITRVAKLAGDQKLLESKLSTALALLREQRSALIAAAVTGQIDVCHHGSRLQ